MAAARQVRVRAHAKINLTLRVGAIGPDGYHELETVFQTLALHDTIGAESRRGPFALLCDDPHVPSGSDNLVWRAAESLWRRAGRTGDLRDTIVTVRKRIPMQAGLGGGSSDAAATLVALNDLWRTRLGASALGEIASGLGADVPSFLVGGTSLGLRRGDEVYPLEDARLYHVVLAFPPLGVSTADAYRWLDADRPAVATSAGTVELWPGRDVEVVNDLAGPVVRRHPPIGRVREALRRSGADVAEMTGSGSAVFGLFRTPQAARRGAQAAAGEDAWAVLTRFAGRAGRLRAPRRLG